jgi:hypothetical protein
MAVVARRASAAALLVAAALVAHLFMAGHGHVDEPEAAAHHAHKAAPSAQMLSFCFSVFLAAGVGARLWLRLRELAGGAGSEAAEARVRPDRVGGDGRLRLPRVSRIDAGVLLRV